MTWHQLSPRQQAVALLVAEGRPDKEIAARLHCRVRTVRYHLDRILDRIGPAEGCSLRGRIAAWVAAEHNPRRAA